MISPPSSPMNSSSRLLNWPRPVSAATSPEAPPSQLATELPRPDRLMRPSSLPKLVCSGLDLRDQAVELHARACRATPGCRPDSASRRCGSRRPPCRRPRRGRADRASARRPSASPARCPCPAAARARSGSGRPCTSRRHSSRAGARSPAWRSAAPCGPGSRRARLTCVMVGGGATPSIGIGRARRGRQADQRTEVVHVHHARTQRAAEVGHLLRLVELHVAADVGKPQLALEALAPPTACARLRRSPLSA